MAAPPFFSAEMVRCECRAKLAWIIPGRGLSFALGEIQCKDNIFKCVGKEYAWKFIRIPFFSPRVTAWRSTRCKTHCFGLQNNGFYTPKQ